jgi:hypothetical protein
MFNIKFVTTEHFKFTVVKVTKVSVEFTQLDVKINHLSCPYETDKESDCICPVSQRTIIRNSDPSQFINFVETYELCYQIELFAKELVENEGVSAMEHKNTKLIPQI